MDGKTPDEINREIEGGQPDSIVLVKFTGKLAAGNVSDIDLGPLRETALEVHVIGGKTYEAFHPDKTGMDDFETPEDIEKKILSGISDGDLAMRLLGIVRNQKAPNRTKKDHIADMYTSVLGELGI